MSWKFSGTIFPPGGGGIVTGSGNGVEEKGGRSWLPIGVTMIALAMAIGFSVFVSNLMGTIEQLDDSLRSSNAQVEASARMLRTVTSRSAHVVRLGSDDVRSNTYGRVFLDSTGNVALLWNAAALFGTERYVLWEVNRDDTTKRGVFPHGATGSPMVALDGFDVGTGETRFLITRETKDDQGPPRGSVVVSSR